MLSPARLAPPTCINRACLAFPTRDRALQLQHGGVGFYADELLSFRGKTQTSSSHGDVGFPKHREPLVTRPRREEPPTKTWLEADRLNKRQRCTANCVSLPSHWSAPYGGPQCIARRWQLQLLLLPVKVVQVAVALKVKSTIKNKKKHS